MEEKDSIHPSHYNQGEIDFIEAYKRMKPFDEFASAMEFNVIKYTLRWRNKNGVQDLDKAMEYLKRLKEYALEKPSDDNESVEEKQDKVAKAVNEAIDLYNYYKLS